MSQIITSPSEMRAFARQLDMLIEQMRTQEGHLLGKKDDLSQTWKDEKYREFHQAFEAMRSELQLFYSRSRQYSDFLLRKAAAGDRYLSS